MPPAISSSTHPDAPTPASIERSLRQPVVFFLTTGAAWLAMALVLGVLASLKVHQPDFLGSCAWLTYGRVFPAHLNALIYGWGMQAAFAMIIWWMARLSRKECTTAPAILTAGCVWNLGVALGSLGILSGHGTGMPWMEFPAFVWPVLLLSYCAIVIGPFIQFRVRRKGPVSITPWYLFAAVIWFPWIFITVNALLHWLPGHPVMAAAINAWYQSALVYLFLTPVAFGVVYELVSQVTGRPAPGDGLAKLGFWSLAIIAPWAGMQRMAGVPMPVFLPLFGAAACVLLWIPVCAVTTHLWRALRTGPRLLARDWGLRFILAGVACLMLRVLAAMALNQPDFSLPFTQFSLLGTGLDMLTLYGFFSLVMFAAIYSILPRVIGHEWLSPKLIQWHFLFSVYGLVIITGVAIIGGLTLGMIQEDWKQPWMSAVSVAKAHAAATTFAWCLILLSNVFFFVHLIGMWRCVARRIRPRVMGFLIESGAPEAAGASDPSISNKPVTSSN